MKICKECGTPCNDETVFCYICGTKFADEQKKIAQSNTITPQNKQSVIPSEDHNDAIAPLLQRISLFLEDEEFDRADEYCERVLDMDPTNAEAYFDKILVEYQCSSAECLKSCMFEISSSKNYAKIMRFGNERQKNTVLSINEEIQRSIRAAEKEAVEDDESRCYDDVASNNEEYYVDIYCPFCNAELSYTNWQIEEGKIVCPECDMQFEYSEGLRRQ